MITWWMVMIGIVILGVISWMTLALLANRINNHHEYDIVISFGTTLIFIITVLGLLCIVGYKVVTSFL